MIPPRCAPPSLRSRAAQDAGRQPAGHAGQNLGGRWNPPGAKVSRKQVQAGVGPADIFVSRNGPGNSGICRRSAVICCRAPRQPPVPLRRWRSRRTPLLNFFCLRLAGDGTVAQAAPAARQSVRASAAHQLPRLSELTETDGHGKPTQQQTSAKHIGLQRGVGDLDQDNEQHRRCQQDAQFPAAQA